MNTDDILKTPELRPCPFCGGKPTMERDIERDGCLGGHYVKCRCGIRTVVFNGCRYWIEASHNFFTTTHNLLAARTWNSIPGEGTTACPECGVAVPHTHVPRAEKWQWLIELQNT